jgi:hypothetical protein
MRLIGVVIPVAPHHKPFIQTALKSVRLQQIAPQTHVYLCIDGKKPKSPPVYPDATALYTGGDKGASFARNMGIEACDEPLITFLDADDYFMPRGLDTLLFGLKTYPNAAYIYSDFFLLENSAFRYGSAAAYNQTQMYEYNLHTVVTLMPTQIARDVGGFSADVRQRGYCGEKIHYPTFVYRRGTGQNFDAAQKEGAALHERLQQRAAARGAVMGCGCNQPSGFQQMVSQYVEAPAMITSDLVRLEYTGTNGGDIAYRTPVGNTYFGGLMGTRFVNATQEDAAFLTTLYDGSRWKQILTFVQPDPLTPDEIDVASMALPDPIAPLQGEP